MEGSDTEREMERETERERRGEEESTYIPHTNLHYAHQFEQTSWYRKTRPPGTVRPDLLGGDGSGGGSW